MTGPGAVGQRLPSSPGTSLVERRRPGSAPARISLHLYSATAFSWRVGVLLTLLAPLHLLDLVHGALEDVALVGLDVETGDVAHGRQEFSQLLDVVTFQLPPPFLQTGSKGVREKRQPLNAANTPSKHLIEM